MPTNFVDAGGVRTSNARGPRSGCVALADGRKSRTSGALMIVHSFQTDLRRHSADERPPSKRGTV